MKSFPVRRARNRWGVAAAGLLGLALAGFGAACVQRAGAPAAAGTEPNAAADSAAAVSSGPAVLTGGVSLLGDGDIAAFQPVGATAKVELHPIAVTGQPFDKAVEVVVKEPGQSAWEVQLTAPTKVAMQKDDVLLATFYARVEKEQESGGGETEFVLELAGEPYTKSVSYPVPLTKDWRQVYVRFRAAADYAPGQAQLIFRLGYAPETIQIGGLRVENFAKNVLLSKLPTTQGVDRKLADRPPSVALRLEPVDAGELAFQINPGKIIRKISRLVYGINSQPFDDTGATLRRNGGNRGSAYNWEQNFSNAGQDYLHQSDQWPCTIMNNANCEPPAAQFLGFFEKNKAAGADTMVTVPMLDFVAADKNGPVKAEEKAPSSRWVASRPRKGKPFADTPDLKDGVVYEDELVAYLVKKLGKADKGGIRFYSLDNEPALWPQTHPLVHPERASYEELVRRTEETASALKDVDKSAFLLGAVMFGWSEYQSLSSAPDSAKYNADFGTYTDFFLDAMKRAEKKHGHRLIDALDIHWYPEARGSQRITADDASRSTVEERLQAPRSLWDPSYTEKSWIAQQTGKPIRLIPWLRDIIQKRYPGTELTLTEYNYGGTTDVSGGLAQADVLGVLGREGVYLATYWGTGAAVEPLPPYVAAAFKLYRNYDGKGGKFGDTAVQASVANADSASVFAATDASGTLTVIAINKHQQNRYTGVFDVSGGKAYKAVKTFVLDRSGTTLKPGKPAELTGSALRYTLEPLSATLFAFQKGG
ncbi:MAG: glycoside hydrolase family 44 protein [Deltaproteobacteria bacterium]